MTTPQESQRGIDDFPADRAELANLTPAERVAIYVNSIRKAVNFFVLLTLIVLVIVLIAWIQAAHH